MRCIKQYYPLETFCFRYSKLTSKLVNRGAIIYRTPSNSISVDIFFTFWSSFFFLSKGILLIARGRADKQVTPSRNTVAPQLLTIFSVKNTQRKTFQLKLLENTRNISSSYDMIHSYDNNQKQ